MLLGTLLEDDPLVCEVTRTGEALERADAWRPDLVIVEAVTNFAQGVTMTRAIRELLPQARMVLLGADDDDATVFEAINAGADGYLTHDTSGETMLVTLRGVLRGEVGLSRAAALRVIHQLRRAVSDAGSVAGLSPREIESKLTSRENDVFALVRAGLRSRDIAATLCIAEGTVYKHIHNILEKLDVRSRNQAVVLSLHDTAPPRHSARRVSDSGEGIDGDKPRLPAPVDPRRPRR
ncbi:MAG: LuxR C-terminal-related transcriptional regulator [Ktedonobacterales bacterium]